MSKKTNKLIPELRFPEFVNEGEWKEKTLIDTTDKKAKWSFTGGPFGSNLKANDYTTKGIRIIQLQNIGDGEFNDDSKIFTSEEKADELLSCNIYSGDIILSKMGDPVGRACIIPSDIERCVMASDGIRLVVDEKKFDKYFVFSLINSKPIREAIEKKATGSTRKRIGLNELRGTELIVPKELAEQQKIATCLSSLDEVITAHNKKLATLKDHKKGLMQNLFPQEGETVPKYRFPEFVNDGEWVEKKLEGCLKKKPEYGINAPAVPFSNKLPTYLRITDISESGRFLSNAKVSVDREITENNYLSEGDIVLARTGASVGKSYKYRSEDGRLVFAGFLIRVRPDANKVNSDFLFQYLSTYQYWCWVSFISARSGQPGINGTEYSSLPISLPPKISEQHKIASILSSLDDLIIAQNELIEQLKLHKKGLMQGLFPKVND